LNVENRPIVATIGRAHRFAPSRSDPGGGFDAFCAPP
jgi:hypothetical protein